MKLPTNLVAIVSIVRFIVSAQFYKNICEGLHWCDTTLALFTHARILMNPLPLPNANVIIKCPIPLQMYACITAIINT